MKHNLPSQPKNTSSLHINESAHTFVYQLDEFIPMEEQKAYFQETRLIRRELQALGRSHLHSLTQIERLLYQKELPMQAKKRLIVELVISLRVEALRILEDFILVVPELYRKWLNMALIEAKAAITSTLIDEKQMLVSSGLGGRDGLLRFMMYFISSSQEPLESYQFSLLERELKYKAEAVGGELEKLYPLRHYIVGQLLLPLEYEPKKLIDSLKAELDLYGNFLSHRYLVTNVRPLEEEEIVQYFQLREEQEKQTNSNPTPPKNSDTAIN